MISQGQDPLVLLTSRAASDEDYVDPEFLAQAGDSTPVAEAVSPTPTVTFQSTSPTVTPKAGPNPTMTPTTVPTAIQSSPTVSPTQTSPTPTPIPGNVVYVTPTPVLDTLPVAGVFDFVTPIAIGGGLLVVIAFML